MKDRLQTSLLLGAIGALYLYTACCGALLDDGDVYASVARQMVERGDWVTPQVNGVRFLDKPPLMYWLMAISFKALGFSELAARLPTVLAVAGTSLLLFISGRKVAGVAGGATAALAMTLAPGTFLFTRQVFPDMLFVFMLTLALYGFFTWYASRGNGLGAALLFYAATAGAVLSKGLIGVVFPAAIVGLFLLVKRQTSWLLRFHPWKGGALFLLLTSPWHVLAAVRTPGFLWYFFVNEHVLRFLGKRQPLDYESIPVFVFWGLLAVWLFPWTAFFPAIPGMARQSRNQPFRRDLVWLCLSWTAVVFVFFSFSSRIEHYSLPIFPPLALMAAICLSCAPGGESSEQRWVNRGFRVLAVAGMAVVAAAGVLWASGVFQAHAGVAPHTHAYSYYFAPLFDLPAEVRLKLRLPLFAAAAGLSSGLVGAWLLNRSGARRAAVLALAAAIGVFCLSASYSLGVCDEVLSSRQFAGALNRSWRQGDSLVVVGDYETANSLNFYTNASLEVYGGRAAVLEWGLKYPDAPTVILSKSDFEKRWAGPGRVFVLVAEEAVAGLNLGRYFELQNSGGRVLICNRALQEVRGF